MARVIITGPAKRDIQSAYDWWKEHRSAEQADRWYIGIHAAINALRNMPERCSMDEASAPLGNGLAKVM